MKINAPIVIILILIIAVIATEINTSITGKAVVDTSNIEETSYVYGNGLIARVDKEGLRYYHNDYLGSPTVITDASGNKVSEQKYDVFGSSLLPEVSRLEFTGKELDDDTNLHYFNARYYDSSVGRFTSADTVKGKLTNPQSLNIYVYTLNNPLKYVDPSGNQANSPHDKSFTESAEDAAQLYATRYATSKSLGEKALYGTAGLLASLATPDTYKKTADILLDTISDVKVVLTGKNIEGMEFGTGTRIAAVGAIAAPGLSVTRAKIILSRLKGTLNVVNYAIGVRQATRNELRAAIIAQETVNEIMVDLSRNYEATSIGTISTRTAEELKSIEKLMPEVRKFSVAAARLRVLVKKELDDPLIGKY